MNSRTPSLGVDNNWVLGDCRFHGLFESRTKRRGGGRGRDGFDRYGFAPSGAIDGITSGDGNGFGTAGVVAKGKRINGSFEEEGKSARRS